MIVLEDNRSNSHDVARRTIRWDRIGVKIEYLGQNCLFIKKNEKMCYNDISLSLCPEKK